MQLDRSRRISPAPLWCCREGLRPDGLHFLAARRGFSLRGEIWTGAGG